MNSLRNFVFCLSGLNQGILCLTGYPDWHDIFDPPAFTSQIAGITDICCQSWQQTGFSFRHSTLTVFTNHIWKNKIKFPSNFLYELSIFIRQEPQVQRFKHVFKSDSYKFSGVEIQASHPNITNDYFQVFFSMITKVFWKPKCH